MIVVTGPTPRKTIWMTSQQARNTFSAPAEGYDRLMGRYLPTLAPAFADAAGIGGGMRLLDVGCGPGGLTGELARRVGAAQVAAIDPSPPFVQACRERNPGVDVREGVAEDLPFPGATFDATLASLVVGFMSDPVRGLGEMARVTKPGGTVAACYWDRERMPALGIFWAAAASVDPAVTGEVQRPGAAPGELAALLREAGLQQVQQDVIFARAEYTGFDDWWSAYTLGVGPAGLYYRSLDATQRESVRAECQQLLGRPIGRFTLEAACWFAAGTTPHVGTCACPRSFPDPSATRERETP
jgi:ubiquinone/menaquinone biosynthesis C-methylase UbiE